jgi:hypothetical protein
MGVSVIMAGTSLTPDSPAESAADVGRMGPSLEAPSDSKELLGTTQNAVCR